MLHPSAASSPAPSGSSCTPPDAADVVVLAAHLGIARHLVGALTGSGLRVDRAGSVDDLRFAMDHLPPPRVVVIAGDDELQRARSRRTMAGSPTWRGVPVLCTGSGAVPLVDLVALLRAYAVTPGAVPARRPASSGVTASTMAGS
jgi:hypothetical protein